MKKGFSILESLVILVIVAFILMLVLKYSYIGVKHLSDTYIKEQAELFMDSSIENSILAIEGYERNSSSKCLTDINFTSNDKRFLSHIHIKKYYCYDLSDCPCNNAEKINTEDSHGMVLMVATVETNNSNPKNNNKKIRLIRTTIQRP